MIWARITSAMAGRRIWLRIKRTFDVDNGAYVLLMPENDRALNEQALRHIDDLIESRHARGVLLLTDNDWVKQNARSYSDSIIDIVDCPEKMMSQLLTFYEFYRFSERLLIVSLDKPYGNNARRSIGVQGITVEDMVCLGMFGIRNWTEPEI